MLPVTISPQEHIAPYIVTGNPLIKTLACVAFTTTSINGLIYSLSEIIYAEDSVDIDIDIDLISELNYEDGTIKLAI